MNQESNSLEIIEGIYDILPLTEPDLSLIETLLLNVLFISIIAFVLHLTWKAFYSNKAIAKRNIKALQKKILNNEVSNHEAIYQLCNIIKNGLKIRNLNEEVLLPKKLSAIQDRWHTFIKNTSGLRYQTEEIGSIKLNELFQDSLFWLKVWP